MPSLTQPLSLNPATEEVLHEYPFHSEGEQAEILERASIAFSKWKNSSVKERSLLLLRIATRLRHHQEACAEVITLEMGKLLSESRMEVEKCATLCEYYARTLEEYLTPLPHPSFSSEGETIFEPLGVILGVMPWNYPLWLPFRSLVPALAAGNAYVLKAALSVSGCGLKIVELISEEEACKDIIQVIRVSDEALESLIAHPCVKLISVTGGERAGRSIASLAGKYLKPTTLELGGSDPFIVLDDADISQCIESAFSSRLTNCGQTCIAAKRFLIHASLLADFTEGIRLKVKELSLGDPRLPTSTLSPMASRHGAELLDELIDQSLQEGATSVVRGGLLPRRGFFFWPSIITGVTPSMSLFREETFGPVFAISEFGDVNEALALANASRFGLGASIWSSSLERARSIASHLEVGIVHINDIVRSHPELPFGGTKASGYGRELGAWGIQSVCSVKTLSYPPLPSSDH
jgi:succinate-semialdehyde dehydrogenase / glutarate-semialdehyde dehydrogenase